MNLAACFIVILINQGLKQHGGDLAIGAFGIVNRIGIPLCYDCMGLNQGMQPIAGYNFGAKQYPRVTEVLKVTICGATVVTTIGFPDRNVYSGIAIFHLYDARRVNQHCF